MKKRICILVGLMLSSSALYAGDTVIPATSGEWKHYDAASETVGDSLRVRILTNGKKAYGQIGRRVKGIKGHYLQVKLGDMESAAAAPQCSNASKDGGWIGRLYSGVNTFRLPDHCDRSFFLSLGLKGNRQEKAGPWCDFKEVRITSAPLDVPLVTLAKGDTIRIGSKLRISFRTRQKTAEKLSVRFMLNPGFIAYRFNQENRIELKESSPGCYEGEVTVDKNALTYRSADSASRKFEIYAMTSVNGLNCYYKIPYPVDITTENPLDTALADAGSLQVRDDRKLWFDRISGVNLARGKKLQLVPKPDYRLTRDDKDPSDLTDGKLTSRGDDRVWFDRHAVGWYLVGNDAYLRLDLGKVQPVEKLVIRLLGGTDGNFKFPKKLQVYVSKDGRIYHSASSMEKLEPCESDQCDWKHYYYLEEYGRGPNSRMYPFELGVHADARWLILHITAETSSIFSDELVCIRAEKKEKDYNAAYGNPGRQIPMEGLIIRPRIDEFAIMKGLSAPQFFQISDMRAAEDFRKPVELVLELPKGVIIQNRKGESLPDGRMRYTVKLKSPKKPGQKISCPPLYLKADTEVSGKALVYARSGGKDQFKTVLPVRTVVPPPIEPFKRLHISFAWISEGNTEGWPDFHENWRKLGFNIFSSFPRYWNARTKTQRLVQVEAARKAGFKIIMNDSPFHFMFKQKNKYPEMCCQIPDGQSAVLCPSYRGQCWDREMERIRQHVRETKPDYVFWDVEIWGRAHGTSPHCFRCRAGMEKSGKDLHEYLLSMGDETVAALKKAVADGAKDAGIPMPVIGSYARHPLQKIYAIERWSTTYPASLDMAQPSLYVAGRAADVHRTVRNDYKRIGNKKMIPFLTAGTYGEFEPFRMEHMVLEALMNGAGGITYFKFNDFDTPLDFYYHLRALAMLRPYEDLVADGLPEEIRGSNGNMLYSMLRKNSEALLLIGNYRSAEADTTVRLPFAAGEIRDLQSGKKFSSGRDLTLKVPRDGFRLVYIRGK